MAVVVDAEAIDVALDELSRCVSSPVETASDAMHVMTLWHVVFGEAIRVGDVPLAVLAAREWRNAKRVIRALARAPD